MMLIVCDCLSWRSFFKSRFFLKTPSPTFDLLPSIECRHSLLCGALFDNLKIGALDHLTEFDPLFPEVHSQHHFTQLPTSRNLCFTGSQ